MDSNQGQLQATSKLVAEKIRNSFVSNLSLLSPYKRSHFAIRLFRALGDSSLVKCIKEEFDEIKAELFSDLINCRNNEHIGKRAESFLDELARNNDKKGIERKNAFLKKKKELFLLKLIEKEYIWHSLGLLGDARHLEWVNFVKSLDLRKLVLETRIFRHYSTQLANIEAALRFMGIINLEADFRKKFEEMFGDDSKLDDYSWMNKLYTMTHFVIADSKYYQQNVLPEKHKWVLSYFSRHLEQILQRTNPDIAAEVGLCFRLAGQNSSREIDLVAEYLVSQFDEKKGYIPRLAGDYQSSEHANSLALIFLEWKGSLAMGPYLS